MRSPWKFMSPRRLKQSAQIAFWSVLTSVGVRLASKTQLGILSKCAPKQELEGQVATFARRRLFLYFGALSLQHSGEENNSPQRLKVVVREAKELENRHNEYRRILCKGVALQQVGEIVCLKRCCRDVQYLRLI